MLALLVIVFTITTISSPGWVNVFNLRQVMMNIAITGMFLCAVAPLLMSGMIDFSGSQVAVFIQVIFAQIMIASGMNWIPGVILAIIIGGIIGYINAFFVVRLNLMAFIATMAMGTIAAGMASWISRNIILPIPSTTFNGLTTIWVFDSIPLLFVVFIVLIVIYSFVLMKTTFGRSVLMCGGNQTAARLAGLNPDRIRTILFINSGAVAAIAGLMDASRLSGANAGMGSMATSMPHMQAFIASIMGGVSFFGGSGSLVGAFFAVALIELLQYGTMVMGLPNALNQFINGMLLIIALSIDFIAMRRRMKKLGIKAAANDGPVMPGVARR